jgi:aquaglyceroporin related protein
MSPSSETAYSPDLLPKRKDWAEMNQNDRGQYGSGPGLQDPNDPIQNSDSAFEHHLEKAADRVGDGPSTRRPSNTPRYEHFEHREHARSHGLMAPHQHEYGLQHTTSNTNNTVTSRKSEGQADRETTLSSIRTKIGLERDAPIVDGHDGHAHLTWPSVRVIFREPFAEFFGTFIMVLFGDGSVAQVLLSAGEKSAPGMNGFGSYQSISWGYADVTFTILELILMFK